MYRTHPKQTHRTNCTVTTIFHETISTSETLSSYSLTYPLIRSRTTYCTVNWTRTQKKLYSRRRSNELACTFFKNCDMAVTRRIKRRRPNEIWRTHHRRRGTRTERGMCRIYHWFGVQNPAPTDVVRLDIWNERESLISCHSDLPAFCRSFSTSLSCRETPQHSAMYQENYSLISPLLIEKILDIYMCDLTADSQPKPSLGALTVW